jgi:hypothetical protein
LNKSIRLTTSGPFHESRDFSASPPFAGSRRLAGFSGVAASGEFSRSVVVFPTVLKGTALLSKSTGFVSLSFGASRLFSASAKFGKTAALGKSDVFVASNALPAAARAGTVSRFESWMWILIAVAALLLVAACIIIACIVKRKKSTEIEEEEMDEPITLSTDEGEHHEYWNPIQSDKDEDDDPLAAATIVSSDGQCNDAPPDTRQDAPEVVPSGDEDLIGSDGTE